jgi:hypothetical protein
MNSDTGRYRLFFFVLFFSFTQFVAIAQNDCNMNIDFGHDYLSLPSATISLKFYSTMHKEHAPAWELDFGHFLYQRDSYVVRAWLTNLTDRSCQNASTHLIDVEGVDEQALPILSISSDSLWIQVSLDCRVRRNPPTAWLYYYDGLAIGAKIKSWTNFFVVDEAVVFICDSMRAFYTEPNSDKRLFPKLAGDSVHADYSMRVIRTSAPWMEVYLYTPSDFPSFVEPREARSQSKNPPPRYWIRYLDDQGRPRIWYLSE